MVFLIRLTAIHSQHFEHYCKDRGSFYQNGKMGMVRKFKPLVCNVSKGSKIEFLSSTQLNLLLYDVTWWQYTYG